MGTPVTIRELLGYDVLLLTWPNGSKSTKHHRAHLTVTDIWRSDPRLRQLLDLANDSNPDVAELAKADLFREFGELDNAE